MPNLYGIYSNNEIDYLELYQKLQKHKTIFFQYAEDKTSCLGIHLSINSTVLEGISQISFGGINFGSKDNFYKNYLGIGVSRKGFFYFRIDEDSNKVYPDYASEKLNLGEVEGEWIANIINNIRANAKDIADGLEKGSDEGNVFGRQLSKIIINNKK